MKRPVRTTLVFALSSACVVIPAAGLLAGLLGWPTALKLAQWMDLCFYAGLLVRWSGKNRLSIGFPLALLLGAALWPGVYDGFIFLGLGMLGWIRSGICFDRTPLRAIFAEILAIGIGAGLVALVRPDSMLAWAVSIWLFFLVQALYFFIVPADGATSTLPNDVDRFDQALRQARRILDEDMIGGR
jgi:hypothetical protein